MSKVGLIGYGKWGTALAHLFDINKNVESIEWYIPNNEIREKYNENHHNCKYFSDIYFSTKVHVADDINTIIENSDIVVISCPSSLVRSTIDSINVSLLNKPVVIATKGFADNEGTLISDYLIRDRRCYEKDIFMISGPSFASEIVEHKYTSLVLSSVDEQTKCAAAEQLFSLSFIKLIVGHNIGVSQMLGVLKNIYAIGAGLVHEIWNSKNTDALYCSMAMQEMCYVTIPCMQMMRSRGYALPTITSPECLGDFLLTCTSPESRNYQFGQMIGKGYNHIQSTECIGQAIEGYTSIEYIYNLYSRYDLSLPPLIDRLYRIIFEEAPLSTILL